MQNKSDAMRADAMVLAYLFSALVRSATTITTSEPVLEVNQNIFLASIVIMYNVCYQTLLDVGNEILQTNVLVCIKK